MEIERWNKEASQEGEVVHEYQGYIVRSGKPCLRPLRETSRKNMETRGKP